MKINLDIIRALVFRIKSESEPLQGDYAGYASVSIDDLDKLVSILGPQKTRNRKSVPITAHLEDPMFLKMLPFMVISARAMGETPRIEIAKHCPDKLRAEALLATWPCPADGKPVQFIRTRKKDFDLRTPPNDLYLAISCPNEDNSSCNRKTETSTLFDRITEAVKQHLQGKAA